MSSRYLMGHWPRDQRGSVLIVAMIFSAIIAVSLASYIQVGHSNLTVANRAFLGNAALNLAESGLEHAMWSINQQAAGQAGAWAAWKTDGADAVRTFTGFALDKNATGVVRVRVKNRLLGSAPVIVSRAIITPSNGPTVERWVEVRLARRSLFANGMVAKKKITFNGAVSEVNSYDSRLGDFGADLGGGKKNINDKGSAGSMSVTTGDFSLGNGKVYGYVAIGTSDYSGLSLGPNGLVGTFGATAGTVDYSRVTTDFAADFEAPTAPTPASSYALGNIGKIDLPRSGDTAQPDGRFYYTVNGISLSGGPGTLLRITNHPDIAKEAEVVLLMPNTVGTTVSISGNGGIEVQTGNHLSMYVAGDISIAGNGAVNSNAPANFQLWGTRTTADQTISVSGNGQLNAVIYAPNADLTMNGGGASGAVRGAAVARNITINGGSSFSYDEALADLDSSSPFGISDWEELTTAADRAARLALVNF
jgi:hypothetical protein